jgi:hypothetical protein
VRESAADSVTLDGGRSLRPMAVVDADRGLVAVVVDQLADDLDDLVGLVEIRGRLRALLRLALGVVLVVVVAADHRGARRERPGVVAVRLGRRAARRLLAASGRLRGPGLRLAPACRLALRSRLGRALVHLARAGGLPGALARLRLALRLRHQNLGLDL